jgi:hypothetical protein
VNADIVADLQAEADKADTVVSLMRWLQKRLGGTLPPLSFHAYFGEAFGISLATLQDVEDWHGFGGGGSMTDDDVEARLSGWIRIGGRAN